MTICFVKGNDRILFFKKESPPEAVIEGKS